MFQNHKNNNKNNNEISYSYSKTSQHHPYNSHHKSARPTHASSLARKGTQTLSSLCVSIPPSSNKKTTASVAKGHRLPCTWKIVINAAVSETFSKDHTLQTTLVSLSASTPSFSRNTLLPITALAKKGTVFLSISKQTSRQQFQKV